MLLFLLLLILLMLNCGHFSIKKCWKLFSLISAYARLFVFVCVYYTCICVIHINMYTHCIYMFVCIVINSWLFLMNPSFNVQNCLISIFKDTWGFKWAWLYNEHCIGHTIKWIQLSCWHLILYLHVIMCMLCAFFYLIITIIYV